MTTTTYRLRTELALSYDDALASVREALAGEGFGVITEIDMRETFRRKLDREFRRYVVLGACNPTLAHQALTHEREIGLLLPCNVIVYEADEPGHSVVAALDPVQQLRLSGNSDLEPMASEVRSRMERVLARVAD